MALNRQHLVPDFGDSRGEAIACRRDCALFDFSFVECASVSGGASLAAVQNLAGRALAGLTEGEIRYAVRVGETGNAVADLTIWKTGPTSFEVMSGRREESEILLASQRPELVVADLTSDRAIFALQGPRTLDALTDLANVDRLSRLRYFTFCECAIAGISCLVGRLGYSGEAGVEIIAPRAQSSELWRELSRRARPAGFTAVDMLRIEAGFVLFTNEFALPVTPAEAGLGRFHDGADSPAPAIELACFRADGNAPTWPWRPPRCLQRPASRDVITVTSACYSVVADGILGLGYVWRGVRPPDGVRDPTGTFTNIRLVEPPFYNSAKRRPRVAWR